MKTMVISPVYKNSKTFQKLCASFSSINCIATVRNFAMATATMLSTTILERCKPDSKEPKTVKTINMVYVMNNFLCIILE